MPIKTRFHFSIAFVIAFSTCAAHGRAQAGQPQAGQASPPAASSAQTETMVVLGSAVPTPLAESPASVEVLPAAGQALSWQSEQDLLRQDSSVFLEQRGAGGGQADIVLRGGTFEQALVLLNGFRIDDAQTSHHNLDLPISLDAMDSIEVLHGAGSTLHGVDALSGVVDFLTAAPAGNSLRLRGGEGSFDSDEESLVAALARTRWSSRVTASRDASSGFMTDRDYRNEDASLESWAGTRLGVTDLLFAGSDRAFGANQFYGPYESWERTKGWFASGRQQLGEKTVAAFGYRRHTDEYILLRDDPSVYENNHIDGSWQGSIRETVPVAKTSALLLGFESDGDSIQSNNLGMHARNRGAGYVDLDLRPTKARWNFSAGAREEIFSGGPQSAFAPHVGGSFRVAKNFKLRASAGYGFRIPTYTDLYYSDPTTIGNPNLKPESAWSGEAGVGWNAGGRLTLSATGFYNRQHDTIDYLRASPTAQWQATNLSGLRFAGGEALLTWKPAARQTVRVAWTGLAGAQASLNGLQSEYALNYPVENVHAEWTAALRHGIVASNAVEVVKMYQQTGIAAWNANAYPVWNAALVRDMGRVRPYLRLGNLSNTGYQQIDGVAMPGRAITGGVSLWLGH